MSFDGSASLDASLDGSLDVAAVAPPIVIRTFLASVPDLPDPDPSRDQRIADHAIAVQRDESPMADLFTAHYARLAGWCARLVGDEQLAHEIASEAFTRMLARWTGLENPHSYLYMIATNLVRDHWRKTARERKAIRSLTATAPADPAYHPVQDVDVRALIEGLPPKLRSPFLLHYYAGFGVREVAAMLGRPEGTVKADLYHARARLKAAVGSASE